MTTEGSSARAPLEAERALEPPSGVFSSDYCQHHVSFAAGVLAPANLVLVNEEGYATPSSA